MTNDTKDQFQTLHFEITNSCTCEFYDEEKDEYFPSENCWGDCWEFSVEDFTNITNHLFEKNETGWWKVSKLRLWDGDVSGFFHADSALKLLQGMSVRSEWYMRGDVYEDRIEYSLSHHDAPMGSSSTLTIISEDEREELGLY